MPQKGNDNADSFVSDAITYNELLVALRNKYLCCTIYSIGLRATMDTDTVSERIDTDKDYLFIQILTLYTNNAFL